ncbi:MAG: YdcF family protein [Aquabacterium sp.]|nr:YdcF family protein [Aquabacterium sp.]
MVDVGMYKPVLTVLAMPPVPFLILILIGARLILPRRGLGYLILLTGVMGIWITSTQVTAVWLQNQVLKPAPALLGAQQTRLAGLGKAYAQQVAQAKRTTGRGAAVVPPAGIVVLGAGRDALAAEYGMSDLTAHGMARLRYGVWLSRQTGLPLGFSGGIGWAEKGGTVGASEAEIAARIAEQQLGLTLRWTEGQSSDTRGNADRTVQMLAEQGVAEVLVVTAAFHMPRAQRAFTEAAQRVAALHPQWPLMKVTPAPMAFWTAGERSGLDWLPSTEGASNVHRALREWLGLLTGA